MKSPMWLQSHIIAPFYTAGQRKAASSAAWSEDDVESCFVIIEAKLLGLLAPNRETLATLESLIAHGREKSDLTLRTTLREHSSRS